MRAAGAALILCSVLVSTSCESGPLGWAVVRWSPDPGLIPHGAFTEVYRESRVEETYSVRDTSSGAELTMEQWRVSFFTDREAAATAHEDYLPYGDVFAQTLQQALPVRSDKQAGVPNIVYRLREGEVVKIVGRDPDPTMIGTIEAYWYRVLTGNGIEGWTYGYRLGVFEEATGLPPEESDAIADPVLASILGRIWRPAAVAQMIQAQTIDLSLLDPAIGLFPEPEYKRFRLVTGEREFEFAYQDIYEASRRLYVASDTSLQITVIGEDEISLQYTAEGSVITEKYRVVDVDLQQAQEEEIARRDEVYSSLVGDSPVLESDSYGRVVLAETRNFTWTGFQRLQPSIIPLEAANTGTIELRYFIARSLRETYDGVISFLFDGSDVGVDFLYERREGELRLVYAPPETRTDNVVTREPQVPVVIVFRYGE